MGEQRNGQQIIADYLNDFLTNTYEPNFTVQDLRTGELRYVSYIGCDDEAYLKQHRQFVTTQHEVMTALLYYFVPSWFTKNYDWAVSLHADKCMIVIKGMDKNYSYFLTKAEAAPAINYARNTNHLVDRRFGQSVDLSHPNALKLIKQASLQVPCEHDHVHKKTAIVTEFRKLPQKTQSAPKAPIIYFPIDNT